MQAALPQPDDTTPRPVLLYAAADPDPVPALAPVVALHPARGPDAGRRSRLQALAALLVLPLALVGTVLLVRPASVAARPRVLVIGSVPGVQWAHRGLAGYPAAFSTLPAGQAMPAQTQIRYRGRAARAQAETVHRSLGQGTLVDAPMLHQGFPVVVYLGKDLPHP